MSVSYGMFQRAQPIRSSLGQKLAQDKKDQHEAKEDVEQDPYKDRSKIGLHHQQMEDLMQRVEQANNIKFQNGVGVEQVMELNLKLREDLTIAFENYIRILNSADKLQRENVELHYRVAQVERESAVELHSLRARNELLEKQVTDRDDKFKSAVDSYEQRLSDFKERLKNEIREKTVVVNDLNALQEKYFQETRGNPDSQIHDLLKQKATLFIKIDKMANEIDNYKLRLIEHEVRSKRETVERTSIQNARRIRTKYKRMRFIGEPKIFQEIVALMNSMDTFDLKSKQRLAALEEFCIFGSASSKNLEKLRTLSGVITAVKSLRSPDPGIVARALCLSSMLTKEDEPSCKLFIEHEGTKSLLDLLSAANEIIRVEALLLLQNISAYKAGCEVFDRWNILMKIVVLIEEGLQLKNDAGFAQSSSCLQVLFNWAKITVQNASDKQEITIRMQSNGVIQTIVKCLYVHEKQLRTQSLNILNLLTNKVSVTPELINELADLAVTPILLQQMSAKDLQTQELSSQIFRNLTRSQDFAKLSTIANTLVNENIQTLVDSLPKAAGVEKALIYHLQAIFNMIANNEFAQEFSRRGILPKLARYISRTDILDVTRITTRVLDSLCKHKSIMKKVVYEEIFPLSVVIQNIRKQDDINTQKSSFSLAQSFLEACLYDADVPANVKKQVQNNQNQIVQQAVEFINRASNIINDKKEAIDVLTYYTNSAEAIIQLKYLKVETAMLRLLESTNSMTSMQTRESIMQLILMLYSGAILHQDNSKESLLENLFSQRPGIKLLLQQLDFALANAAQSNFSKVKNEASATNYKLALIVLKIFFVIAYKPSSLKAMVKENILLKIEKVVEQAIQYKESSILIAVLRLFTFFSSDEKNVLPLIQRQNIRALFLALSSPDRVDIKFFLVGLKNVASTQEGRLLIKETSWKEGINQLVTKGFRMEPRLTSLIFEKLFKDEDIRSQITTMMSTESIDEVLREKGFDEDLMDPEIPLHVKYLFERKRISQEDFETYLRLQIEKNSELNDGKFKGLFSTQGLLVQEDDYADPDVRGSSQVIDLVPYGQEYLREATTVPYRPFVQKQTVKSFDPPPIALTTENLKQLSNQANARPELGADSFMQRYKDSLRKNQRLPNLSSQLNNILPGGDDIKRTGYPRSNSAVIGPDESISQQDKTERPGSKASQANGRTSARLPPKPTTGGVKDKELLGDFFNQRKLASARIQPN